MIRPPRAVVNKKSPGQIGLKTINFVDVTFNLEIGTYRLYKRPSDFLLYINTSSNHLPQVIKRLPTSIYEQQSKNSSSEEIFNASKHEYEAALKIAVINKPN